MPALMSLTFLRAASFLYVWAMYPSSIVVSATSTRRSQSNRRSKMNANSLRAILPTKASHSTAVLLSSHANSIWYVPPSHLMAGLSKLCVL